MRREQEHVLNACLLPSLQQALGTTFRRAEQSKGIGNSARLILGQCRGIVRWLKLEPGLLQPVKIRRARISEKGLTRSEGASHPSRARLGGSETEREHEHHREFPAVSGRPALPLAPDDEALRGWLPNGVRPSETPRRPPRRQVRS